MWSSPRIFQDFRQNSHWNCWRISTKKPHIFWILLEFIKLMNDIEYAIFAHYIFHFAVLHVLTFRFIILLAMQMALEFWCKLELHSQKQLISLKVHLPSCSFWLQDVQVNLLSQVLNSDIFPFDAQKLHFPGLNQLIPGISMPMKK